MPIFGSNESILSTLDKIDILCSVNSYCIKSKKKRILSKKNIIKRTFNYSKY